MNSSQGLTADEVELGTAMYHQFLARAGNEDSSIALSNALREIVEQNASNPNIVGATTVMTNFINKIECAS